MTFVTVPNGKGYLDLAVNSAYERMTQRITEAKRDSADVAKLRQLFIEQ